MRGLSRALWRASLLSFLLVACTGANGKQGYPIALRMTPVAPSESCAAGGIVVESGLDDGDPSGIARNGTLEDGERDGDGVFVCHGATGDRGEIGAQGPKGDRGETGAPGPEGDKGDPGAQGPPGPKGETGATGEQGLPGVKGDTGAQGLPGVTGDTGEQGPPGAKGETGATGATGATGTTGAAGTDGKSIATSIETISAGAVCAAGGTRIYFGIDDSKNGILETAERDSNVVVCNGPTGTKGDKGETGATGTQGPQGDTGPQGPQGLQGSEGPSGVSGAHGANCWEAIDGGTNVDDCVDYVLDTAWTNSASTLHLMDNVHGTFRVNGTNGETSDPNIACSFVLTTAAPVLRVTYSDYVELTRAAASPNGRCLITLKIDGAWCDQSYVTGAVSSSGTNLDLAYSVALTKLSFCRLPNPHIGDTVHVDTTIESNDPNLTCSTGNGGVQSIIEVQELPPGINP